MSLKIHNRKLFFAGIMTIVMIPALVLLQTFAEKLFYTSYVKPDSPYHQTFYLCCKLDGDVRAAKAGYFPLVLEDWQKGLVDQTYIDAIQAEVAEIRKLLQETQR